MPQSPEPPKFGAKDFVHLHLHSDYSLLQSTVQLKPLAKRLVELEQQACAITDYGNMYGAVSFFNTMTGAGIRPIIGYEAFLKFGDRRDKSTIVEAGEKGYYNLVLLATNLKGYQNLTQLSSRAFTEGLHYKPRIDLEILSEYNEGLIALSGGAAGPVGHFLTQGEEKRALEKLSLLTDIFGKDRFYLEIHDTAGG